MGVHSIQRHKTKVVILAGSRDFGRCPLASRLPTALWPMGDKTVLEHLLWCLSLQGIEKAVICCNSDGLLLADSVHINKDMEIEISDEPLPVGTAGSLRDAVNGKTDELLLVLPASIVHPPDIDLLIAAHKGQGTDLTVVFNPSPLNCEIRGGAAGIYVCDPAVLKYIPREGYYDIKEGLIAELLRVGTPVHCAVLPHSAGNFRSWQGYLRVMSGYLLNAAETDIDLKTYQHNDQHVIWKGSEVIVESGVKIYGRVVLLDNARVEAGAVVFGPTILGRSVSVGRNSVVVNSVLWDDSRIGENCEVQRSLIDYGAVVRNNSVVGSDCIISESKASLKSTVVVRPKLGNGMGRFRQRLQRDFFKLANGQPSKMQWKKLNILLLLMSGIASIAFLWSYWPGIVDLWNIWHRSDEYSSGLLVPFLAVYILWSGRKQMAGIRTQPSLWGLPAFVGAQAVRFFGLFFMYGSAERLSIVLSIAALILLLFGWEFFRKVSPVVLFLFLMLPWPNRVQAAVTLPLQRWATSSAVFCLEAIGYEVVQEGNIIHIGRASVAVAEACNGLRMVTAFFVISGLVVLLVNRAWWEKLVVFVSSLPIALFCNTARLALTSIAFTVLEGEFWEKVFHDFGGYAMMPMALVIVVGELWFLSKLTTSAKEDAVVMVRGAEFPIGTENRAGRRVDI